MKFSRALLFGIACAFFACPDAAAAGFIEGLEDVPVMDGLVQIPNDNISFGNEESRFVEAQLESTDKRLSFKDVDKFYRDTLPQLGWLIKEKLPEAVTFTRDSEIMEIAPNHFEPLTIRITVKSLN